MRNLAELNINLGGEPVKMPPPTVAIMSAFEHEFDIALPEEYINLLMYANGGNPEVNMIDLFGGSEFAGYGVETFYYLNEDRESFEGLWNRTRAWRSVLGKAAIPIADAALGSVYYLDLASTPAKVMYCSPENLVTCEVAPSLSEFIDSLRLDPDMI